MPNLLDLPDQILYSICQTLSLNPRLICSEFIKMKEIPWEHLSLNPCLFLYGLSRMVIN